MTIPREHRPSAVLSPSRQERRDRILNATLTLASRGGYDAVQMRDVADAAEVAVGTLYRYFPSKVHLLVSALARELKRVDTKYTKAVTKGVTSEQRMQAMIWRMTRAMQKDPLLTEAMTRAFMFADTSASAEVEKVGSLMDRIFAKAMTDDEPTESQLAVARVVSDIWMSNLVAWLTRRASATAVAARMEVSVRMLLEGYQTLDTARQP